MVLIFILSTSGQTYQKLLIENLDLLLSVPHDALYGVLAVVIFGIITKSAVAHCYEQSIVVSRQDRVPPPLLHSLPKFSPIISAFVCPYPPQWFIP